jgi:FAD/FMN-containing dehydrogenase
MANIDTMSSVPDLRADLRGNVITPDDEAYDGARTLFYGGMDRHPALIARVADTADVARVVSLARETGAPLTVRSGGHSIAGHSVIDDAIVVDLSSMRAMDIDVEGRTAWAETGLTAGEYTTRAAEHGLATGFGDTGSVGIGGITLGGGVGFLARKYGLTIDDLLAAEVVTADGDVLEVNEGSHPDLFWAIRGGGGNFGVATRFRFRLHEVGRILGGMLILPATPETIVGFLTIADSAPDELTTIANVMPAPPMPFVPEEHHGKPILLGLVTFAGDPEAGTAAVAPLRDLAEPIADMVRPMSYPEMYMPDEEGFHPVGVVRNMFVDELDHADGGAILDALASSTAMMSAVQIRVLGGAVSRVPADATAYGHRARRMMINVAALFETPEQAGQHEVWADELAARLRGDGRGAYVNFLGDEGEGRIRDAYPEPTWNRMREIKGRYDPANRFRFNQNIPPATVERG